MLQSSSDMPQHISSSDGGSPSRTPLPENNQHPPSSSWESEDGSYPTSVYSPQQKSEVQQPSHPTIVYHSTDRDESSNYQSESTQSSIYQDPTYVYQPHPSQESQYYYQPECNEPWSPAATTSDVHNRNSRSHSLSSNISSSSSAAQYQHAVSYSLSRFLTINPAESSLRHEENKAISEGLVMVGENVLSRMSGDQRWRVPDHNSHDTQDSQDGSDSSRTLGRSEDGMAP